jgi:hypothetical protein
MPNMNRYSVAMRVEQTASWRRTKACLAFFMSIIVANTACQQPIRPTEPTMADLGPSLTPDEIWDHSLSVLRTRGFQPDIQDRANGRITTEPETTKQWYEPWRSDVGENYDVMMASLHTMQRMVTVQFRNENDGWKADVKVEIYQLSEPEPQITSASSVLHGYTGTVPDRSGQRPDGKRRWRRVARDGALEAEILQEIVR